MKVFSGSLNYSFIEVDNSSGLARSKELTYPLCVPVKDHQLIKTNAKKNLRDHIS